MKIILIALLSIVGISAEAETPQKNHMEDFAFNGTWYGECPAPYQINNKMCITLSVNENSKGQTLFTTDYLQMPNNGGGKIIGSADDCASGVVQGTVSLINDNYIETISHIDYSFIGTIRKNDKSNFSFEGRKSKLNSYEYEEYHYTIFSDNFNPDRIFYRRKIQKYGHDTAPGNWLATNEFSCILKKVK